MMIAKPLALLAAALFLAGAAPPKAPTPKAAPAKTAGKPAAPRSGPFDSRDPASLVALLTAAGAKAEIGRREDDAVLVAVTSVAANFSVQFVGCDRQGRACKAALFDNASPAASPTFAQLNAFSQTSVMCRAYQDRAGKPHVVYSTLVFADDTRARASTQLAAWQGCIGEFRDFLANPNAYLAAAP
jgi:hypothetical protein